MAENKNTFQTTVESLMKGMDGFVSSKTVVGEPIQVGETIILPLVDVSFGMGAGAFCGEKKKNSGGGIGGKMSPSSVLVIQNGSTRLVSVKNQDGISKLLDMIPDFVDKFVKKIDEKKNPDVYKKPGLYHDDEELKQMQTTYNEYLLHFIQWDMGNNVKETLGPDALKDCIKVNTKRHTVKLDQPAVEKWLESFCLKYKTQGIARTFKTHSGKKIKVSGGDYGWRIDYDKVIAQTMKALKKAPEESAIKAYEKDPSRENEQALLTGLKPVYSHKGYRMDYTNKQNDWDTQNYSEVDLSAQEVFVYKKGKLVFSTTCITGKATPDRITRTGVYDIKEKKLTKTLTGADYSVPTRYWTRIMWTGTGYHYSSRGDWGSWSPTYYKTNGSHGCVNLTLSDARSVYNLTKIGDPVFIHY